MFDPTAFENIRVVMEGALYDRDLHGDISIIDRNDWMNMSKLARKYEITFTHNSHGNVPCQIILEAGLENLAAELLSTKSTSKLAGASLTILFRFQHEKTSNVHMVIKDTLKSIWGEERTFEQRVFYDPMQQAGTVTKEITIHFNRLIFEEQMDDLIDMLDYCLETIEKLAPHSN